MFPLRRYLSKVFFLSYNFLSLLTNLASSHQMGHVLDTLIIERIDPVFESNTFTLSKDVVQYIVMDFGFTDNDAIEDDTSSIVGALPPSSSFAGAKPLAQAITNNVHCEALLLRYHFLNPTFPPFNYIGVSKLSRYPCCALFHTFNKSVGQGHKYFVKGCHSKIYPNWILPKIPSLDSSIGRYLVKKHFGVALMEWLKIQSDSRCNSVSCEVTTSHETESQELEDSEIYTLAAMAEVYEDLGLDLPST
ncbi:hypothetical protein BDR07DRAFT_529289 [Suillus spraguei]|nr:hypothetical protein BDR07DRAFT_529289 [Suillus spraguei]